MPSFDPPGFLQDFNQQQQEAWSDWMSQQLDDAKAGQPDVYDFDAPRPRFFNVTKTPLAADAVEKDISWTAFPRWWQSMRPPTKSVGRPLMEAGTCRTNIASGV
ncbi:hypothetical protein ACCS70_33030 [Rhizobium ruizarguesonis]|jgi:hypothetical protein|uniref:hypothetical protein n=1 Tax=Rhizobium ruizarguesonis TaxID=2081791 RepID=UPI0006ACA651|nr:hypothetical protein [Rhizobium ruizarguesonis]NKL31305.1 hypothetical protein [Rhizobium leguminosarum bv. viciae]NEH32726.1 hypothetical protein [Rhizobium ruizarguesonis]NEJ10952.1 hypothetical protein [Rhizobium ruizarguesonis]NEJ91348.1 hypothetical protein [Rhizobium ruizarguesonis]NEK13097.1 hypothetical protein [Rhizobium ruizarguesonis]